MAVVLGTFPTYIVSKESLGKFQGTSVADKLTSYLRSKMMETHTRSHDHSVKLSSYDKPKKRGILIFKEKGVDGVRHSMTFEAHVAYNGSGDWVINGVYASQG